VWHEEMLQAYIKQSKWPDLIAVHCISSTTCSSAGDALRELDSMGVIRSDPFILISGDVVSNMNLEGAIKFHKEKKKEDSNTVMTLVMKTVQQSAGIQPVMSDLVVGMDSSSSQILWFDEDAKSSSVNIPVEILLEHPHLDISSNLLDCHIDICSPELMLQFSDNFDYQDIRNDFIRNEAVNWELGMHIYGYLLNNDYAARVQDPGTYHHICRDIVSRWAYPIVSDAQLLQDSSYAHGRGCVYKEDSVRVARSAEVESGVVIGRWSTVGNHTKLLRSSIGRRCKIGANVTIVDSHIWDDATIEDNAVVRLSVICSGAIIKKNAKINKGCILSYNTIVGEGTELPPYTRLTLKDGQKSSEISSSIAGVGGKGSPWKFESSGDYDDHLVDSEDVDENEDADRLLRQLLQAQSMGSREEILQKVTRWGHVPEPELDTDDMGEEGYENEEDDFNTHTSSSEGAHVFGKNVCDMVVTGYDEGHPADNVLMEIKGYKFSQNKSFQDCLMGAFPGLAAVILKKGTSKNTLLSFAKTFFQRPSWGYTMLKSLLQTCDDE